MDTKFLEEDKYVKCDNRANTIKRWWGISDDPEPTTVKVTFHNHYQGAEFDEITLDVAVGDQIVPDASVFGWAPPVPQLHFAGWAGVENGPVIFEVGDTVNVETDMVVYTIWEE